MVLPTIRKTQNAIKPICRTRLALDQGILTAHPLANSAPEKTSAVYQLLIETNPNH